MTGFAIRDSAVIFARAAGFSPREVSSVWDSSTHGEFAQAKACGSECILVRSGEISPGCSATRPGGNFSPTRDGSADHKNRFDTVAEPFHQGEGLPFSDVLNAESIERALSEFHFDLPDGVGVVDAVVDGLGP